MNFKFLKVLDIKKSKKSISIEKIYAQTHQKDLVIVLSKVLKGFEPKELKKNFYFFSTGFSLSCIPFLKNALIFKKKKELIEKIDSEGKFWNKVVILK